MIFRKARCPARKGLSSLEVVMATGVTVPIVLFLLLAGMQLVREFYQNVATLVCWPY